MYFRPAISAWHLLWLITSGAVSALSSHAALAADVDCTSITMRFPGPGYAVDCEAEAETLRTNSANGGGQYEVINVTADDESNFLHAYDIRATGDVYYTHQSLYNRTKSYFGDMGMVDWRKGADFAEFEVGEFNSSVRSLPSQCLAFQRAVNRVPGGYRRVVFGIGCSLRDRAQVYDALKLLDAPGD